MRPIFASIPFPAAGDRRGVAALMFAILGAFLLGIFALATEVGFWYLTQGQMGAAADAAAISGAAVLTKQNDSGAATTAATDVATYNGFTQGVNSVTVTSTPNPLGDGTSFQVTISSSIASFLHLFEPGSIAISASATATAVPLPDSSMACVLSLVDPLILNATATPNGCLLASNATGPDSVQVNVSPAAWPPLFVGGQMAGLWSTGGWCEGCSAPVSAGTPPLSVVNPLYNQQTAAAFTAVAGSYQPPTPDPVAAAIANDGLVLPTPSQLHAVDCSSYNNLIPAVGIGYPAEGNSGFTTSAYYNAPDLDGSGNPEWYYACTSSTGNITLSGNVGLLPGTYFIYNSDLTIAANATVQCWDTYPAPSETGQTSSANVNDYPWPMQVTYPQSPTFDGSSGGNSNANPCIAGPYASGGNSVSWYGTFGFNMLQEVGQGIQYQTGYGVTIVMLGDPANGVPPGKISIDPSATVILGGQLQNDLAVGYCQNPPSFSGDPCYTHPAIAPNPAYNALNTVVFYSQGTPTGDASSTPGYVFGDENGKYPPTEIAGIFYFPNAHVEFDTDLFGVGASCAVIIAYGVTLGGSIDDQPQPAGPSGNQFGCTDNLGNLNVPTPRYIQLQE